MTFSIIVAAYNRKDILIEAIRKIMGTGFPKSEYEIIIGDNNSSDGTRERVEEFTRENSGKVNLKYLVETRKGNVYARHSAVKHAIGKYLVFCDDDCFVADNWLTEIDRIFRLHPEIGLLGTRIEIQWDKSAPAWMQNYQYLLGEIRGESPLVIKDSGLFVNSGSMAIPKELFEKLGGTLPEQIGGKYVGDGETGLCLKLHNLKKPIALTNDTFVYHYQLVEKNARIADIRRRFENNGIGEAYNEVYRQGVKADADANKTKNQYLWVTIKDLLRLKRSRARGNYFRYSFFKKKAEYINKFLRESNNSAGDWVLSDHYAAPDLVSSSIFVRQ
ncbi:MAG TPA: glycosyltransferase [Puia sp.]|nr:glycosyltransferase [Puia sp.]